MYCGEPQKHDTVNRPGSIRLLLSSCTHTPLWNMAKVPAQFSHPSCFGMESALVEPPPLETLPPVQER